MSLRLSDYKVLHNIASSSSFLHFARIFSLFSLVFRTFKFLEFKECNKTIIPLALVGYETGYSQLGATRLVGYLPSHFQLTRAHGIVNVGQVLLLHKSAIEWFSSYCDTSSKFYILLTKNN